MKYIDYVFYRFYVLFRKGQDPWYGAMVAVNFFASLIFFCILSIISILIKIDLVPVFFSNLQGVFFGIALFLIGYFVFVKPKRYKQIESKFGNESKRQLVIGTTSIIMIYIISIVLFIFSAQYRLGLLTN